MLEAQKEEREGLVAAVEVEAHVAGYAGLAVAELALHAVRLEPRNDQAADGRRFRIEEAGGQATCLWGDE